MGGTAANDKGVLTSTQGNSYRAAMPATGAKTGEFQKPAPRIADGMGGAKPGDAGKENATASRSAAATASTSGDSEHAEKRWQVRSKTIRLPEHQPLSIAPRASVSPPHRCHRTWRMVKLRVTDTSVFVRSLFARLEASCHSSPLTEVFPSYSRS